MRLLPNEKRSYRRRRFIACVINHFLPAQSCKTLSLCYGTRTVGNGKIPIETFFHQFRPSPQCKMNGMPPMHFEMRFTKPTVIGETGFLRRKSAGTIHFCEILRQYHSSFQFMCPLIGAAAEIDKAAAVPEFFPVIDTVSLYAGKSAES